MFGFPTTYNDEWIEDTTFTYDEANNRTSIIEDGTYFGSNISAVLIS